MPRSPKDNQEIREARRGAILAAATRVFTRKGFAKAKISDIAAEAKLSHGLVYHYFPSKAAIFGAIADAMMSRVDEQMRANQGSALERIVASLEQHRMQQARPVDEQRVIMQALLQGSMPEEVKARLQGHFARLFERVQGWIAEAQADGDIAADLSAEELTATLICVVRGMSIRAPNTQELPFSPPRTQTIVRLLSGKAATPTRSKSAPAKSAARRKVRDHASRSRS